MLLDSRCFLSRESSDRKHFHFTRFTPSWNKVVPLCAKWAELNGRSLDQEVFIQALAKDFNMTVAYARMPSFQVLNVSVPFGGEIEERSLKERARFNTSVAPHLTWRRRSSMPCCLAPPKMEAGMKSA